MKKMKVILAVCSLILVLAACGKPFTCDFCGDESTGRKHTEDLYGEEIVLCDDCYDGLKELADLVTE